MKLIIGSTLLISALVVLGAGQKSNASGTLPHSSPTSIKKTSIKKTSGSVKTNRDSSEQDNSDLALDDFGSLANTSAAMMILY